MPVPALAPDVERLLAGLERLITGLIDRLLDDDPAAIAAAKDALTQQIEDTWARLRSAAVMAWAIGCAERITLRLAAKARAAKAAS